MTEGRRLLAVSYMLPPALYPQAIQIGRLLAHTQCQIAAVSGAVKPLGVGLDNYSAFDERIKLRLCYPFEPKITGLLHRLAMRVIPFYGRSPDEYRAWAKDCAPRVLAELAEAEFKAEVLVTFGEPMSDHLLGLSLKPALACPWIAHFSDPWADNPFRRYTPLANFFNRRDERAVVAAADAVIFTSEETKELVMGKYPKDWKNKCHVLPHSFQPDLYPKNSSTTNENKLLLRYLGNFYGHRSPEPLFRALLEMQKAAPELLNTLEVEIIGTIPKRMLFGSAFHKLPSGLVSFRSTVPYSKSLELMQTADLLLVIDGPDKLSVFLPSKLVDYVGAGKPIFGIVPPGASARAIENLGGLWASPTDIADIVDKLKKAIHYAREYQGQTQYWGRGEVRADYHVDIVAKQFNAILSTV